jgi:hypothetical protein
LDTRHQRCVYFRCNRMVPERIRRTGTQRVRSPSRLGRRFLINLGLSQSIMDATFSLPWTCNAQADFNP